MRTVAEPSDGEVSSHSHDNSSLIDDSALTPCGVGGNLFKNLHCNSSFLVRSGKGSKGFLNIFSKSKDACVFPFISDFQFRLKNGGSAAGPTAALEKLQDEQSVQAAAAIDCSVVEASLCCYVAATVFVGKSGALATGASGSTTIVLGDNGGCAYAATDPEDATNSEGIAEHTDARAFREFDVEEVLLAKDHG